jgi:transcriptional regulator
MSVCAGQDAWHGSFAQRSLAFPPRRTPGILAARSDFLPSTTSSAMYTPRAFKEERPEVLRAAIEHINLATLVTVDARIRASHIPMMLDASPGQPLTLIGHLARANDQWKNSDGHALAVFLGPHHYISPSWYPSKVDTGMVVPTWNYIAIHAQGEITFFDDEARLRDLLERLTSKHESGRKTPWQITDAPADYIARQMRAIVGFSLRVTSLEGQWKLSQNKDQADYGGVMRGLEDDGAHDILSWSSEPKKSAKTNP